MRDDSEHPASMRIETVLDQGDELARTGDWPGALARWSDGLNDRDAAEASRRIRWFLAATNHDRDDPASIRIRRRRAYRVLFVAAMIAALGTVVTLLGIGSSGLGGTAIAVMAWTCFGIAIALCLWFARLLGAQSDLHPTLRFGDQSVAVAADIAAMIDQHRNPEEQVVHPSPTPVRK
jgi:hypothetical protein